MDLAPTGQRDGIRSPIVTWVGESSCLWDKSYTTGQAELVARPEHREERGSDETPGRLSALACHGVAALLAPGAACRFGTATAAAPRAPKAVAARQPWPLAAEQSGAALDS